jgi:hypothetical protein
MHTHGDSGRQDPFDGRCYLPALAGGVRRNVSLAVLAVLPLTDGETRD